jgi:hypothetical protein
MTFLLKSMKIYKFVQDLLRKGGREKETGDLISFLSLLKESGLKVHKCGNFP